MPNRNTKVEITDESPAFAKLAVICSGGHKKNRNMNLNELKNRIFEWTDFYGGDIISADAVRNAKTKKDLADALEEHRSFMEAQLSDANSHLDNFKKELGLTIMDGVG